ncbi:CHAT domain-containing protein [Flavobacteriaceae bacterium TP-CH-4]|uniref:CHAT domain-containing protein n=1 Tax=Pelagihabitans pacificus TaxID=2696054 RepID=A0A967AYD6_9FLAO|nr:CHAT domain-containing protein [Pelagihabitans pacificus]NHF61453.1 CHAT domain-containing protein [Pelagihabitans pacificus]
MIIKKPFVLIFVALSASVFGQEYEDRLAYLESKAFEHYYTRKDSAYYYFEEARKLGLSNDDTIYGIDALLSIGNIASFHYDFDKMKGVIQELDSLLAVHGDKLDTLPDRGDFQRNYLLYHRGNYFHKLEEFNKSELFFDTIVQKITEKPEYLQTPDNVNFLSTSYSFIAKMNALQNRFQIADEYYQKNIRLFAQAQPDDVAGLHRVYNLYANSLYIQKKIEEAKKLWLTTLKYSEQNFTSRNRNSIITTSFLLAKAYSDLGKIDSAYFFLDKYDKYKIPQDPFAYRYFKTKGEILIVENKNEQALNSFGRALELAPQEQKPVILKRIGDFQFELGQPEKSLATYQKGLRELTPNFNSDEFDENPRPYQTAQKQLLLKLLNGKAQVLNSMKEESSRLMALHAVETSVATLDSLKPKFKNEKDKAFLIEDAFPTFEHGLQALYSLYRKSNRQDYLEQAFHFFEKSKSVVLLDAILSARASEFSQIPKELLERESELKSKISMLEKQIDLGSDQKTFLRDELFDIRNQYRGLIKLIEKEHRQYFNLKYNSHVPTLAEVRENLNQAELIISYFYGNNALYSIGISKEKNSFYRTPIDSLFAEKISAFYRMCKNSKSDIGNLAKEGYEIYATILKPHLEERSFSNIRIMPDGPLNYLPFGALNIGENTIEYLVESTSIYYANSEALLQELKQTKKEKNYLLAVAPTFNGIKVEPGTTRNTLSALPHNKSEVEQIMSFFEGSALVNQDASLTNFSSNLQNFDMLHLATHGDFNDMSPEYSYLAFTPKSEKDFLLYVKDIYNLELKANLVTLSACETGIGELKRGEGFLSLARAFFYSGAKSIASTLWKVNDASSSEIMGDFYRYLAEGASKDEALRQAKLVFLKNNNQNARQHPYYWAGYVISGNMEPIHKTDHNWVWFVGGLVLVVGTVYWVRKKAA